MSIIPPHNNSKVSTKVPSEIYYYFMKPKYYVRCIIIINKYLPNIQKQINNIKTLKGV